jgi:hypothetical protein
MNNFSTYQIRKGDTLLSVAIALGYSVEEMLAFHNAHCEPCDSIEDSFSPDLKEVIIPVKKSRYTFFEQAEPEEKQVLQKRIPENSPYLYLKENPNAIHYGVEIHIDKSGTINTIKYEMSMKLLRSNEKYHLFEIDKTAAIYINDVEADSVAEEIAVITAGVLYPLQLVISASGELVELKNFSEIIGRWTSTQLKLREQYTGEWIGKYIELTNRTLADQGLLLNSLRNDYVLRSYFNGIYGVYTADFSLHKESSFPFGLDAGEIAFSVTHYMEKHLDEYHLKRITSVAEVIDLRSGNDIENGFQFSSNGAVDVADKLSGSYTVQYFLDPANNFIRTLLAEYSLDLDQAPKITVMISDLESGEEQNQQLSASIEEQSAEKQKSFWIRVKQLLD